MCGRTVAAHMPSFFEHGDVLHLACHLGLMDAAAAVARMLLERPEHALCIACIADALVLTASEADVGITRVQALPGFGARFGACVGCGRRGRVVRALRGSWIGGAAGERAAGAGQ
jgi:hypothetical protein